MAGVAGFAPKAKVKGEARDEAVALAALRAARGWDEAKVKAK